MATTNDGIYPVGHPVLVAFHSLLEMAENGHPIDLDDVRRVTEREGLAYGSREFDEVAAMVGLPYSPTWDVYVSPQTWADVELSSNHARRDSTVTAIVLRHLGRGLLPN